MPLTRFVLLTACCVMILALFHMNVHACLNDMDTKKMEKVIDASTLTNQSVVMGHFPREMDLYYQMRIQRATLLLIKNDTLVNLYDDISVANDRLGRFDEAIRWQKKKLALLQQETRAIEFTTDDLYRHHANIGTHYIHRWLKNGANADDLSDVKLAKEHISEALKINPDAHFGREQLQLDAMTRLLDYPKLMTEDGQANSEIYGIVRPIPQNVKHRKMLLEKRAEGLRGIIVLGAAWESVDVFFSLMQTYDELGMNEEAALAYLRCEELIGRGKFPLALLYYKRHFKVDEGFSELMAQYKEKLKPEEYRKSYWKYRKLAIGFEEDRELWLLKQYEARKHPDTHPQFYQTKSIYDPASYPSLESLLKTDQDKKAKKRSQKSSRNIPMPGPVSESKSVK